MRFPFPLAAIRERDNGKDNAMLDRKEFQAYLDGKTPAQDANEEVAKTFLKKTLEAHDKAYHPNGYKEGDECNFRAAMMKNDIVDDLIEEKPEKKEVSLGLVKYKEGKDGKKKVEDIVDIKEVAAETGGTGLEGAVERYLDEVEKD